MQLIRRREKVSDYKYDTGKDERDEGNSGRKVLELSKSLIPQTSLDTKVSEKGKVDCIVQQGASAASSFFRNLRIVFVTFKSVTSYEKMADVAREDKGNRISAHLAPGRIQVRKYI